MGHRFGAVALAGLMALLIGASANADVIVGGRWGRGLLRVTWDGCDPINKLKQWVGPQDYSIVASIAYSDSLVRGFRTLVRIEVGAGIPLPDAWRFDSEGCQAGQLSVSRAGFGKQCTVYGPSNSLMLHELSYDEAEGAGLLDVTCAFDPFDPDPAKRYVLWRLVLDHAYSVTGPTSPGVSCGSVGTPITFRVDEATMLDQHFAKYPLFVETRTFWWEGLTPGPSPIPIEGEPVRQISTWGRVKSIFR